MTAREDLDFLDAFAEALIPKALHLVGLVHGDGERRDIEWFLADLDFAERQALPVILAALVPDDRSARDLLAWKDQIPSRRTAQE